ncbi:MAG: DUF4097 family beta strand repeat-containing protein [Pyrinomonadaceae bacterium]
MRVILRNLRFIAVATIAMLIGVTATQVLGQDDTKAKNHAKAEYKDKAEFKDKAKGFCSNNSWSSDDKVSFSELREITTTASGTVNVDGGQNGGISVKGEDRGDILIRACVQVWAPTDAAARAAASNIRIGSAGGMIKADGADGDKNWSVSYQILAPRSTNLSLKAHNGGISVSSIDGSSEFETMNGGVSVSNASGSVKGRTMNGGVNVVLSGSSWKGSGLDVSTTNGGINLVMPANFAARVETATVNGGFSSEIPALQAEKSDKERGHRATKISADLNGGGAPIRIVTTNGGVRISTPNEKQ